MRVTAETADPRATVRPFARGLVFTVAGHGSAAAVSLVRNVLVAQALGPAAFGVWSAAWMALRLTLESHAGALSVLAAEAPVHRGAGRVEAARAIERGAVAATIALALVAAALAVAGVALTTGIPPLAAVFLAVTVVLQQQFFADAATLRSRGVFARVAVAQTAFALVHAAWLVPLLRSWALAGALASWSLALAAAIGFLRVRPAEPLPPPVPSLRGADLVRRGMPAFLVGITFALLMQTDRFVVGALLGTEALGHYSVLGIGAAALLFLPEAFGRVFWPVAGERFGQGGEDPAALAGLAERAVRGLALASAAGLAFAVAATDVLVERWLPGFAAALPALRLYLVGVHFLALTIPPRFVLVTTGRSRRALALQVAAIAAAAAGSAVACAAGGGLPGVAGASAIVAASLLASLLGCAAGARVLASRTAMRLFAEAAALAVAAVLLDAVLASAPDAVRLGVPALLCAASAFALLRASR